MAEWSTFKNNIEADLQYITELMVDIRTNLHNTRGINTDVEMLYDFDAADTVEAAEEIAAAANAIIGAINDLRDRARDREPEL